jgi:hypothetical protein
VKQLHFLSTLLLCACASACARTGDAAPAELVIPNFEARSPACHVFVAVKAEKCADQSCVLPAAKGAAAEPVELRFTCLPASAPTGFENPASDTRVHVVRTGSANGAVSIIDDINTPAAERQQELNFCLYGKQNNLCGSAKTAKISGKDSPTVKQIISLVERMSFTESAGK